MSLLENAYDFLNESLRSAERAGQDSKAWKFAVLHVVQAIELLLKARLHAEHPVLI
jgi:HEPN domain-containing protein